MAREIQVTPAVVYKTARKLKATVKTLVRVFYGDGIKKKEYDRLTSFISEVEKADRQKLNSFSFSIYPELDIHCNIAAVGVFSKVESCREEPIRDCVQYLERYEEYQDKIAIVIQLIENGYELRVIK